MKRHPTAESSHHAATSPARRLIGASRLLLPHPRRALACALLGTLAPALPAAGPAAGWGTSIQTGSYDTADFSRDGMNLGTIRTAFFATSIESTEGVFTWDAVDNRVDGLLAAGIDVMGPIVANSPPAWMRAAGSTIRPDKDKFAQYALDVITHYNTGKYASPNNVKYFEVGNESDGMWDDDFANSRQTADAYFEILQAVWEKTAAFRASHPDVKLIGGVIAGAPVSRRVTTNNFFDQLWTVRGGWQYMDILSFHFYIRNGPPETYYAPELGDPGKGRLWDQVLMPSRDKIGDHPLPVWATETGFNLDALASPSGVTMTQAEHAKWLVRSAIIMRGSGFVDRFLQFACYANSASPGNYGFRNGVGGALRDSYDAYGTMAKVLDDSVTSLAMQDYYRITTPSHCAFRYHKTHGYDGWAVWWVPDGTNGANGPVTLGAGAIPPDADIWTRTMSALDWTPLANPGTGSISVIATDEPLYVEVRPAGAQLAPRWAFDTFAKPVAVRDTSYAGSIASDASDPDYDPLVFSKVGGPAWLAVAADGTLSGTPGASDLGTNAFTVRTTNAAGIPVDTGLQIEVLSADLANPPVTSVFYSIASEDGTITESAPGSGVGGVGSAGGSGTAAMRSGDEATNTQRRSIISFDTSPLPDDQPIEAAMVRVRRGALAGQDPFNWAGACKLDIKRGGFGGNTAFALDDFQAPADRTAVGVLSHPLANGDWAEAPLTSGLEFVNLTGKTQFRFQFDTPTNNNGVADYIGWHSANTPDSDFWPQLLVTTRKPQADLTVGSLIQAYDGSPKPVNVIALPAGLGATVTYDDSPTPPTAVGLYTVIATITDPTFNGTAAGVLAIIDVTPPVLRLPGNLIVEATSPAGATVDFTVTAGDDVNGSVSVQLSPASGSVFPLGPTMVTAVATDAAGNTATGTFTVTVRDNLAPSFQRLTASPAELWPANHKLVAVTLAAQVVDAADPAPVTRILGVACNEPVNGPGDGHTAPDWEITGPLSLQLRAERAGSGPGRIYTITVEGRDAAGNTATRTVNVTVPHNR